MSSTCDACLTGWHLRCGAKDCACSICCHTAAPKPKRTRGTLVRKEAGLGRKRGPAPGLRVSDEIEQAVVRAWYVDLTPSKSELARTFGIDRKTVIKIIKRHEQDRPVCDRCGRPTDIHVEGRCPSGGTVVTLCPRNHPYDEANTHISLNGRRNCRACNRERQRASRLAKVSTEDLEAELERRRATT